MPKKILITGCSGFIGRHAVSYALNHGYRVVGLDRREIDIKHRNLVFVNGTINDRAAMEKAARGCDYVLHLAAMTSLPDFQRDLYANYTTNVVGFMNAIEAARKAGCKKFAYASSSGVYLDKFDESAVIDIKVQRNHYMKAKLIDEMIADSYSDAYGMKTLGLRFFNVYGPGEEVKKRSSPIAQFMNLNRKDGAIKIFGDGKQSKDFVHVDDVTKITFMLIGNGKAVGVYNIGTGVSTSFNGVAKLMHPKKIVYVKNPYLSTYIFYLKSDNKKLLKAINGYKFISVEEGISRLMTAK